MTKGPVVMLLILDLAACDQYASTRQPCRCADFMLDCNCRGSRLIHFSHFLGYRIAQRNLDSSSREDMNPESLCVT